MTSGRRKLLIGGVVVVLAAIGVGLAFMMTESSGTGVWHIKAEAKSETAPFALAVEMPHKGAGKQELRDYIAKIAETANDAEPANEPIEIGRVSFSSAAGAPPAGYVWVILLNPEGQGHKYVLAKETSPGAELRPMVGAADVPSLQSLLVENFYKDMELAEQERISPSTQQR